jgi:N utilization substance protein B
MPNDQKPKPDLLGNKDFNPVARHHARRCALQAMYEWQMADTPLADIERECLIRHQEKQFDLDYFKQLMYQVPERRLEIDQTIQPFLSRPLEEVDPIELAVLRLATYELLERTDIPYRVIINEALELTKQFGSVEGHKFVNGVLDRIAKKIPHRT